MNFRRRTGTLAAVVLLSFGIVMPLPAFAKKAFRFQDVQKIAKDLSTKPFQPLRHEIPDALKEMGYDQWRDLRYKDSKTLWNDEKEPFKVRFFHPGFNYRQFVTIHYIDDEGVHDFNFSADLFDYGQTNLAKHVPAKAGFAGFRIHYPLNRPDYLDELVAFLGASYFRALPEGLFYGMSVRGLAINTALDIGEEFPFFNEFWIVQPHPKDKQITVYALLDSDSVAGAYEYVIEPGPETIMNVRSTLFVRQKIEKLGIAPLTSMYFYGENTKTFGGNDFRPEVHDSDGLLISTRSGEWIWRPLDNPQRLSVNSFYVNTPRGFGLLQRDASFDHYQDLEARYELRPSVWVKIKDNWGNGHVELVQIPTRNEYNDNINAFWVPEKTPQPGDTLNFSYQLQWHWAKQKRLPLAHVTDTRISRHDNGARFFIDFQGGSINGLVSGTPLETEVSVSKGYKIANWQLMKNTATGGWRLVFDLQIDNNNPLTDIIASARPAAELRAQLRMKGRALTETWTYTWME